MAHDLWKVYNSEDHSSFNDLTSTEAFPYLEDCLKAHSLRFPSHENGLNFLETLILNLINEQEITSERQLCGKILSLQGYYGFGDSQIFRLIDKLRPFFFKKEDRLFLYSESMKVLENQEDASKTLTDTSIFGGSSKYHWRYDSKRNRLIKNHS